jgi:4,5-dihydroxyphthalate decarboxylase
MKSQARTSGGADLDLTLGMADYDKTAALRDGSIKPARINLTYVVSPPSETFWRMLKFDEFDASEMSLSSFLIARGRGRPWTAIPIFPFRAFFHTLIFVNGEAPISRPADLVGKRFGVPEYQVTAAVWTRGVLQHEFQVPPSAIRWVVERRRSLSHGGETGFEPPAGVSVEPIPEGETLFSLLTSGKLDAVMPSPFPGMKSMLNQTDLLQLARSPRVRLLFPDPVAEGVRYYRKNGFSHVNHTVIIQDAVLQRHPWAASSLFQAFSHAKRVCYANIDSLLRSSLVSAFGHLDAQRRIFGDDPYPYGVRDNRTALQTLADYAFEQGLIPRPVAIEEVFAETTRDV